jgi:transcriptional regulator with XRE-family HTH domain
LYARTDHAGVEPQERFGVNLRKKRLRLALSQEELGLRCGLDRTEVSLLERGGRSPQLETILKLAGVLRTTPNQLCAGIKWSDDDRHLRVKAAPLPAPRAKRPPGRPPSR